MKNPYVLWVDLETTGTEEADDIIELGALLTEGLTGPIVSNMVKFYRTSRAIGEMDPFVIKMHVENGLWDDVINAATLHAATPEAEAELLAWLGQAGALKQPLPLAGSGVSHFDRRFIAKTWPKLNKRLAYAMYDVGVLRRFLRGFGLLPEYYDLGVAKAHRALDDIMQHRTETIILEDMLRGWQGGS